MPKRTAWLHVGLPGTGAPAVAAALSDHADRVEDQGFRLSAVSEEQLLRAALELRREHQGWGYRRREVEGSWAEVCRRAHRGRRHPLIVSELLAACDDDAVALLLDGLAPLRTEVVVTMRDPATQVLAAWADTVRLGRTVSFAGYADRLLDPEREHTQARRFWAAQHVGDVLDRWSRAVGPEHVHVVVLPQDTDPAPAAWAGLAQVVGLDPATVALPTRRSAPGGHRTLDPVGAAVVREVNRAVDGRVTTGVHRREVAPSLVSALPEVVERGSGALRPRLPDELHDVLARLAVDWRAQVVAAGHPVHGDLDDLLPAPPDPTAPLPDDVPVEARLASATEALADVLVEVARLRRHNAALEGRVSGAARRPRLPSAR